MNRIEPIINLPDLKWTSHCQKEIEMTGEELVESSDFVWRIGNVASVGFVYDSLLSPPWMWFLLAESVTLGDLIDFRRLSIGIPKGTLTSVEEGNELTLRFAKIYGFEDTGEVLDYKGTPYRIMRKK